MTPRFPSRILSLALGLTLAAVCGASAGPAAADTATVAYHIDNHDQQVTVKDGAGRTLLACHAATPTLQAVLDIHRAANEGPVGVTLTLEDRNGLRLWSTPVPPPRQLKVVHSVQFACNSNTAPGAQFVFTFSDVLDASAQIKPGPVSATMVCLLGADGRFVSMKGNDSDGQAINVLNDASGMSLTSSDGTVAHLKIDGTGTAFDINGTKATGVWVKRDGKDYFSFPWNGHQVLVQSGCSFTIGPDGELTINAPVAPTAPAKK